MSAAESGASADRNLLFGILALQMDFISRDALIQAMNAWVLDKAKPLGRILLEQHALNGDEHDLLQAVVQKHIDKHGGDVHKSLAAVRSVDSVREQLHQVADAELHASLAHVAAGRSEATDAFATRAPSVGVPTSSGTRFRILRPHAKGGLGEVFVAQDTELHREVALKEIQESHADNRDSRARFLREAEITGGLEHPGIVPVYGLGQYADGRPYYAMRFIPGDSFQEAISQFHKAESSNREYRERALSLRQLLGRFVDTCDAIAYAHSRGVVHRDLKPGNVMLGPYGETLVVDWGLAKPLGSQATEEASTLLERPLQLSSVDSATPTQMGAALGTPAYMPPEQAAGRLDQLGPASDVYSLGAMLYCLLTGKAPFVRGEVGEVLRRVQAGDFPRPRQVTREVPAALEAVCLKAMALKPSDRYESARALAQDIEHWLADEPVSAWGEPWPLRARRWLGRHRTLVTTAAATLVVATASLTAATVLLQAANTRERQANADKEAALRRAEDNAADARQQEKRALKQKRQAEDNAREAKHQKERAEQQKRETEQQAAIVLAVNEFLQRDLLGQAEVGSQLVAAREQRDPDVKVRTLLDRASQSIEGKFKEQPLTEAAIRQTLGNAYRALGEYAQSQRHLERSLQLRIAQLEADHPDVLTSKHSLAHLAWDQGKYDLAEPLYKEVVQARTAKLGADHRQTLVSKSNLALLYKGQGKYDLAERLFKDVIQGFTVKFSADHPHTLISKNNLASLYQDQGKYDLAEPLLKEVLQAQTLQLSADHPYTLTSQNNLARLYHQQGKSDLAEQLFKEVIQAQTAKRGADHPDTLTSKNNLALLYLDQGKCDLAEPLFKEVLQGRMAKLPSDHPDTLVSKDNLAVLYKKQRKYDLAESLFKEVLPQFTAKLGANHPDTLTSKNNLAVLYHQQRKYDLAEPLFKEVLQGRTEKLGADHPDTVMTMANLGVNYRASGRTPDGIRLLEEALHHARKRPGGVPPQLTGIARQLLRAYEQTKQYDKSEPLYRASLDESRKRRGDDDPETATWMSLLGFNLLQQKKYADAEPILRECLAIRAKKQPDSWATFNTCSLLGDALAGQKKYAEAEPLLLRGYEGMKQREKSIPPQVKMLLIKRVEQLVQLYDAWGKKDKADPWRKKLAAERAKLRPAK